MTNAESQDSSTRAEEGSSQTDIGSIQYSESGHSGISPGSQSLGTGGFVRTGSDSPRSRQTIAGGIIRQLISQSRNQVAHYQLQIQQLETQIEQLKYLLEELEYKINLNP